MYICPLDDHLLLTLGYDTLLKKNTLNFLLLSFSTKEEDNIQNFKGRSKFTRVPKLCPPPPLFFSK